MTKSVNYSLDDLLGLMKYHEDWDYIMDEVGDIYIHIPSQNCEWVLCFDLETGHLVNIKAAEPEGCHT